MQKQRGKAWKEVLHVWRQVDVREAVPDHCNSQTFHWSASSLRSNELYWRCLTLQSHWQVLGQDITRRTLRFFIGHCPLTFTLMSTWCHACDSSPRPFPSVFTYCKWSKTGGRNGLGTKLSRKCMLWYVLRPRILVPWDAVAINQSLPWPYQPNSGAWHLHFLPIRYLAN